MSKIFKFTIALVLFTLVSIGFSILTGYQSVWQIGFVFLMPVLWTLWIACVISHKMETKTWKLILLWILIDLAVLLLNRLAFGSFHGVDPKGGSELVWLIEFAPPILPIIPISMLPVIGTGLTTIVHGASFLLLPVGSIGVLKDWLEFSILSAISSFIFAGMWFHWKFMKTRRLAKQVQMSELEK